MAPRDPSPLLVQSKIELLLFCRFVEWDRLDERPAPVDHPDFTGAEARSSASVADRALLRLLAGKVGLHAWGLEDFPTTTMWPHVDWRFRARN